MLGFNNLIKVGVFNESENILSRNLIVGFQELLGFLEIGIIRLFFQVRTAWERATISSETGIRPLTSCLLSLNQRRDTRKSISVAKEIVMLSFRAGWIQFSTTHSKSQRYPTIYNSQLCHKSEGLTGVQGIVDRWWLIFCRWGLSGCCDWE